MLYVKNKETAEAVSFAGGDIVKLTPSGGRAVTGTIMVSSKGLVKRNEFSILNTEEYPELFFAGPLLKKDTRRYGYLFVKLDDGSLNIVDRLPLKVLVEVVAPSLIHPNGKGNSGEFILGTMIRCAGENGSGDDRYLYLFEFDSRQYVDSIRSYIP